MFFDCRLTLVFFVIVLLFFTAPPVLTGCSKGLDDIINTMYESGFVDSESSGRVCILFTDFDFLVVFNMFYA